MIDQLSKSLYLVYQPIVDSEANIVKLEVLIRYDMDAVGMAPQDLIEWAEKDIDAMIKIDQLVFARFLAHRLIFSSRKRELIIALNVSPISLAKNSNFIGMVQSLIAAYAKTTTQLEVEVLESWICPECVKNYQKNLAELRKLGMGLSLDDFGSGYACVRKLTHEPFTNIKIDGDLVGNIDVCLQTQSVVGAVIKLAHKLGKTVTAEKVESVEQFNILKVLGCDYFQGYLFGKPAKLEDIFRLMDNQSTQKFQIANSCHF